RVSAGGGLYIEKDGRDIPDTFLMTADYPDEYTIFLVSTLANDTQIPERIYGKHGTREIGGDVTMQANGDFGEEFKAKNEGKTESKIASKAGRDMVGNFLSALRDGAALHCNADLGCAAMVAIKLAVESYRQSRTMVWDAQKEKITR
ncbi:MAG: hypothetical protein HY717_08090, partial [Planctomycetes bacterium]|nr:hypothetical protein [Planctomycetota bacterium]